MASLYTPDRWVIVEFNSEEYGSIRKVFAGWYGGFGGSDSWKLSSGITSEKSDNGCFIFRNESGSTYQCYENAYGMSGYMSGIFALWNEEIPEGSSVKIVKEYCRN